jgi:AcrR family transcriptional regulator
MPPVPPVPATRTPRADARRNRDAVLAAARSALARGGLDSPMEAVARAAGVGVATVYRNFPTKAALVDAVIERSFRELTANATAALAAPDVDRAFFDFLRDTGKVMARDRVLVAAARAAYGTRRPPVVQELFDMTDALLARAVAAGAVRAGMTADDLPALLSGAGDAAYQGGRSTPRALERYLDVIADGLRAR